MQRLWILAGSLLALFNATLVSPCLAQWPANQAALSDQVQQLLKDNAIPGAVVLMRQGDNQWLAAFGVADLQTKQPMQTDMAFRVGSNTKTMTGTVILQLVQEGKLKLDDKVSQFFQDVPQGDQITIADLLEMRSGINTYSELKSFNRTLDQQPDKIFTPEQLIKLGTEQPAMFKPGSEYFYSNTNYVMLGVLIERLTGKSLEEAFQERIFQPLNMTRSLMPAEDDNKLPDPFARGYLFGTNENPELSPEDQQKALAGKLPPTDVTNTNPSWAWAAGGAISTATDLAAYVEALVTGGLLDDKMQAKRLASIRSNNPAAPNATGYGLGIAKLGPMLGHDGSLPGYQSFMGHDPQAGLTLIVLANLQEVPEGEGAANVIAKALLGVPAD
ncbi:D-alanyl-D-alanine carboxypeptidase [Blastopirellula marina]|uniref:D-alanyl-D-alanine carboxypeptidase n=1 Tax=Blastopirellula marina TaxID=124 RepID=A0A2S8FHL7_9BACT|nr:MULTISPECIES: serine hydrolase domain-containing protein [Pirellulaceae]PQO31404.1 D-alanyl-D-alanine carboxypeptidase [Blastopirellula marina]RCS51798.1 class A beta-lactamase-related serine hydrolase [Bremerella cremea]